MGSRSDPIFTRSALEGAVTLLRSSMTADPGDPRRPRSCVFHMRPIPKLRFTPTHGGSTSRICEMKTVRASTSVRTPERGVLDMTLKTLGQSIRRWWRVQMTIRELNRLDDAELNDLGIGRWRIPGYRRSAGLIERTESLPKRLSVPAAFTPRARIAAVIVDRKARVGQIVPPKESSNCASSWPPAIRSCSSSGVISPFLAVPSVLPRLRTVNRSPPPSSGGRCG